MRPLYYEELWFGSAAVVPSAWFILQVCGGWLRGWLGERGSECYWLGWQTSRRAAGRKRGGPRKPRRTGRAGGVRTGSAPSPMLLPRRPMRGGWGWRSAPAALLAPPP